MKVLKYSLFPILLALLFSCSQQDEKNGKLQIVVTTGMIEDALKNIVGDKADVSALLGPNSDPHMAQASKGDLQLIQKADIIIKNGLHLEGKLGEALEQFSSKKPIFNLSDGLDEEQLLLVDNSTIHDPHVWFDVALWKSGISYLANEVMKLDSLNRSSYQVNTDKYLKELEELDREIKERFMVIDTNKKVLITAHDAFRYFGKAYNINVIGIQGVSTLSQTSIKKRANLSDFIIEHQIGAIFPESSVRDNQVSAIIEDCEAKGFKVEVGHTLYSDALGEKDSPAGTYIGMVQHNISHIIKAMQ